MPPKFTPAQQKRHERVIELRKQGVSRIEICRQTGLKNSHVGAILAKAGLTGDQHKVPELGPLPPPPDPIEEQQRKNEERARQREYVDSVSELAFRGFLDKLVQDNVSPMPAQRLAAPRKPSRGVERFPHLCLNDWHFEERVDPAGVLDLNTYNIKIACQRVYRIVHETIAWKEDMEAGGRYVIPELSVALIGDFLTGTLHGLEKHSDAPNVVRAALACGDLIALAIGDLADHFPNIRVCGVVGNHGRLPDAKKVPTKDPTRSWDYVAYQVAKRRLAYRKNITWDIPDAYGVLFSVGGHLCYAAHGNFIPNNLGVVGYGIRRFTSSLSSNLQAAGHPLKYAFFGHWHNANSAEFSGIETFICPSLIGTQEYGFLSGGAVNRPAQGLFVFDKDLGIIDHQRFYGEHPTTAPKGTYELTI